MKNYLRKINVSLLLSVLELVLGILLLINPTGLTSVVVIVIGILLILLGLYHLFHYVRLPREEASHTWKLATGTGIMTIGIVTVANQGWLVEIVGAAASLYGIILLTFAFMKLQIMVDAIRGGRKQWYMMAACFLSSAILATLLFTGAFTAPFVWIFSGILLIMTAILGIVYFLLGRRSKPAESEPEEPVSV